MVGVKEVPPSSKKRKTLAEEIAELSNPTPVFKDEDPEQIFGFGSEARRVYDSDDDFQEEEKKSTKERLKDKHLRLRGDISLNEGEYSGKRTSRKDLSEEGGVLGVESEDLGEREGEEREEGMGEEEEEDGDDDDVEFDDLDRKSLKSSFGQDAEIDALDREYAQLREEEKEVLKSVKPEFEGERKKGLSVSRQRALWDRNLELRISLQKALQTVYGLPEPSKRQKICSTNEEAAKKFASLSSTALSTFHLLLDIQQALLSQNGAIQSAHRAKMNENGKRSRESEGEGGGEGEEGSDWDEESTKGGRGEGGEGEEKVDIAWRRFDRLYERFVPFRNASVDRWQRKTMLSAASGGGRGKLRALSKSVSEQVAAAMANPTRMIERTRIRMDKDQVVSKLNPEDSEEIGDPETYDDSDFYQQLLHEFLESSDPNAFGSGLYALKKLRNKKRKVVDRRASKGRKIRYTVLPKLVNFMAAEPMELPPMAEKLMSTLFGQKPESTENSQPQLQLQLQ